VLIGIVLVFARWCLCLWL